MLDRAKKREAGNNIKDHLVLDYDLWKAMDSLQELIHTPLRWEKVDSHIEGRVYKEGTSPKGDQYSIRLNGVVDEWAGLARKGGDRDISIFLSGVRSDGANARQRVCIWRYM